MTVPHPKGVGALFGLVLRILLSIKWINTNQLDYMALIINYVKKIRVGGSYRE